MKFTLDKKIDSNNKLLRMHWAVRSSEKDDWMDEVLYNMPVGSRGQHNDEKKTVEITSFRKRLLDRDNLWGGCKLLIDSLVFFGLIKDDTEEWVDLKIVQKKSAEEKTIIEISKAKELDQE